MIIRSVAIVQFDNFYQILSNLEIVKQTRSFVKYIYLE